MLGAETYDRLFLSLVCGPVFDGTVNIFVEDEIRASAIAEGYSWHVATAIESILRLPVRCVNVLPQHFSGPIP
jgi:hypothetical protein